MNLILVVTITINIAQYVCCNHLLLRLKGLIIASNQQYQGKAFPSPLENIPIIQNFIRENFFQETFEV